jgi:hypothetical protein
METVSINKRLAMITTNALPKLAIATVENVCTLQSVSKVLTAALLDLAMQLEELLILQLIVKMETNAQLTTVMLKKVANTLQSLSLQIVQVKLQDVMEMLSA